MHGMLSAAVMLAAFAAVALAAAASVVWVYRAAGASVPRSRPAPAGLPAGAAGSPDTAAGPDTPAAPGGATPDGAAPDQPDWLAEPGRPDGLAEPDQTERPRGGLPDARAPASAAPPRVAVDVYDVEDWAGPDERGDQDGVAARGPGGWPNPSSSLYSRGWPAMDSSRADRDAADTARRREPDGQAPGAQGAGDPADGQAGPHVDDEDDVLCGVSYEEQGGQDPGRQELGRREVDHREWDAGAPGEPEPGHWEADTPEADTPEADTPERPEGARVYILGESRRRGR